jgi:hypothetical protein
MDNRPDNFTVMNESSWLINNNQYRLYKLAEAKIEQQDFHNNLYTRISIEILLIGFGSLVYTLIMVPNILIGAIAFFSRWIRLG